MTNIDSRTIAQGRSWKLQAAEDGSAPAVHPRNAREAAQIDADGDGVCSDAEIETYLRGTHDILPKAQVNVQDVVLEFKQHLEGTPNRAAKGYRSLEKMEQEMHELADAHPDLVQMQSIAKTAEGRDVWALKITSDAQGDTTNKPGVVITGTHHAREWMTPEVTLQLAEDLANKYGTDTEAKRRLDNAELWFIPVVNPDGFQYSRTEDSWWRKNRTPVYDTECPGSGNGHGTPIEYGVDLNRNYWDGNPDHMKYFRADGDTPCSTWDDVGASDDPGSDTFRGKPGQEPEVAALMQLEYQRPNIKGVLDHHSYGGSLLRPWGHTEDIPENVADYDAVAARMNAAQGSNAYDYHQSVLDYPTFGSSETCHQANGKLNFTVEMGSSFQPDYKAFKGMYKDVSSADLAFIDFIIEKNPVQAPAPPPTPDPTPAPEPPPPSDGSSQEPCPPAPPSTVAA